MQLDERSIEDRRARFDMPELLDGPHGNHADRLVPVLLRMSELQNAPEAEAR
jgi:hypothetical protein